jgi:hypothetical protein
MKGAVKMSQTVLTIINSVAVGKDGKVTVSPLAGLQPEILV